MGFIIQTGNSSQPYWKWLKPHSLLAIGPCMHCHWSPSSNVATPYLQAGKQPYLYAGLLALDWQLALLLLIFSLTLSCSSWISWTLFSASTLRFLSIALGAKSLRVKASIPYIVFNGDRPMALWNVLLHAKSTWDSNRSQALSRDLVNPLKRAQSCCWLQFGHMSKDAGGVVLEFSPHLFLQSNPEMTQELCFPIKTMALGMPCSLMTSLKYKSLTWVASLVLAQAMKWTIFENLVTTTKIESFPLCPRQSQHKIHAHIYSWSEKHWQCCVKPLG